MGTKQVQMKFQVVANDGALAQVTVTAGGTQVFSGSLAQTENPLANQVFHDSTPFSLVQFELDVADMPVPGTGNSNSYGQWVTSTDITISVTGGNVCLQETLANYTFTIVEVTPPTTPPTYHPVEGNASTFAIIRFANQPVWTPTNTDPGRLIFEDNINTGPGSLTIFDNQSVAYQASMTLYSA
jgi:hypothetical protein